MTWPRDLLLVLALVALALVAPTFENERPYSHEARANIAQRLPVGERLAYASLSDLRLVEVEVVEEKVHKTPEGEVEFVEDRRLDFKPRDSSPYIQCVAAIPFDRARWKGVNPQLFVLAIAATENYNRQFLHRKLEMATDRAFGMVGLDLDPTLGLTQVRASRARALLNARVPLPLGRAEVADFLKDDCNAMTVTAWWFEDALGAMTKAGETPTVQNLALRYNGGTGYHASEFPYALVVKAAYGMLETSFGPLGEQEPVEPVSSGLDTVACFHLDAWGKALTGQRYVAVRDGRAQVLSRAQFLAMIGDDARLRYTLSAPASWTGVVGQRLRDRVAGLVGVKDGRWLGHGFERMEDGGRGPSVCGVVLGDENARGATVLVAREGREDVEAALLAMNEPPRQGLPAEAEPPPGSEPLDQAEPDGAGAPRPESGDPA